MSNTILTHSLILCSELTKGKLITGREMIFSSVILHL